MTIDNQHGQVEPRKPVIAPVPPASANWDDDKYDYDKPAVGDACPHGERCPNCTRRAVECSEGCPTCDDWYATPKPDTQDVERRTCDCGTCRAAAVGAEGTR